MYWSYLKRLDIIGARVAQWIRRRSPKPKIGVHTAFSLSVFLTYPIRLQSLTVSANEILEILPDNIIKGATRKHRSFLRTTYTFGWKSAVGWQTDRPGYSSLPAYGFRKIKARLLMKQWKMKIELLKISFKSLNQL